MLDVLVGVVGHLLCVSTTNWRASNHLFWFCSACASRNRTTFTCIFSLSCLICSSFYCALLSRMVVLLVVRRAKSDPLHLAGIVQNTQINSIEVPRGIKNSLHHSLRPTEYTHKISWKSVQPFRRSLATYIFHIVTRDFYILDIYICVCVYVCVCVCVCVCVLWVM
jgi:hypothetical protein